jgi:pimeloyl-ACP methyl ester carboxylesterase
MGAAPPPRRRSARRGLLAATIIGGVGGAALAERRHLRSLAGDPDLQDLSRPLREVGWGSLPAIASADGTLLHAEWFGGGADPTESPATLVLAPGWTEELALWRPVIRRLAGPSLRVVAYDLRGHGRSQPAADGDYALERLGEDVAAVLAATTSAPERTALAGHSLGGMSIAAWAAAHDVGERVAAAALVNVGLDDLLGGALILGELGARLTPTWLGRVVLGSGRPLLTLSTPVSHAAARHIAFGPDASDGMVAFYERMLVSTEPHARGATGLVLSQLDLSAAVSRITVPTLVIAGDRDRLTPPAHARRIAAALPRPAGLEVLPRTGHMSPLERPDEVADALGELLHETGVAPRES